jgi:hypothetical protein
MASTGGAGAARILRIPGVAWTHRAWIARAAADADQPAERGIASVGHRPFSLSFVGVVGRKTGLGRSLALVDGSYAPAATRVQPDGASAVGSW